MSSAVEILESIERRLAEAQAEILTLEAARAALTGDGAARVPARAGIKIKAGRHRSASRTRPAEHDAADGGSATAAEVAVAAPRGSGASRRRSTRRVGKASRSTPTRTLSREGLEAVLREHSEGLNAVAIAQRAKARDVQVRGLLRELQGAGDVRRVGSGRATRWRLVTDEERIAERAAELARRGATAKS
jgi:hypothetical protein